MISTRCLVTLVAFPALLAAQAPVPLDTVRVTAASRLPGSTLSSFRSMAVIEREQLLRLTAATLTDVLATTLGMDVRTRSPAQADVAMRGSTYNQVLVLVDGLRVNDAQTGHFNLDLAVPLALVERIEIVRGAGSALYGADAVGGVINIVTDEAGSRRADSRAWGGSFGTVGVAAAGGVSLGERTRVRGGTDHVRSDGHRAGTDFDITQIRLAADLPAGSGRAALDAGLGIRNFGAADFYGPYPSYEETRTTTATARYESRRDAGWLVDARAATRRHSDVFTLIRENPAAYQNHHVSWQTQAELVARRVTSGPWTLAAGGEGANLRLESARLGDRDENRAAAYAEITHGRPEKLTLNAGLRVDGSSDYGGFFSPSAALSLPIDQSLWLRASLGRGFRAPTWTERFYEDPANVGDPNLAPERFVTGEIGVRWLSLPGVRLDLVAFTRDAEDVIDWAKPAGAPDTVPWRTMNVSSASYRGLEAQLEAAGPLGIDWRLEATGLEFNTSGAAGYVGKYALRPILRTVGLSASAPLLTGARITFEGMHVKREGEGSYEILNARAAYRRGRIALTIDALNLTNAEYLDAAAQPAVGRAVYLGGEWTFGR